MKTDYTDETPGWRERQGVFRADSAEGLHALRTAARANLLAPRVTSRAKLDEGGIGQIDLEAASHPKWRAFLASLNFRQRTQLDKWRGGGHLDPNQKILLGQ